MYAATTKDEGNDADGRFSTACKPSTRAQAEGQAQAFKPGSRRVDLDFRPGGGKRWKGLRRGTGLLSPILGKSMK
jgi:hypothetical protein